MEFESDKPIIWKINGKDILFEATEEFAESQLALAETDWEHEIWLFVQQWFQANDHIEVFTSGSTGRPSSKRLLKRHMELSAIGTLSFLQFKPNQTALICLPARYIAGKMMIVRAIVGKLNLVAVNPAVELQIPDIKIDFAAFIPSQMDYLLEKKLDFRKIVNTIIGGAAINEGLAEKIASLPNRIYATYGMTETITHIALQRLNGADKSNAYKLLPGFSVQTDERDCLLIKTPYFEQALQTNDVVKLISPTEFIWLGRADFVINSGGVKIFPENVEKKLSLFIPFPIFVYGLPDKKWGQRPVLFLEIGDLQISAEYLKNALLQSNLSKIEMPGEIYILEKFSYTENFKIDRKSTVTKLQEAKRIKIF